MSDAGRSAIEAELLALVEAYATAVDAGDGPALGALFLPGARLTTWPPDGSPGQPHFGAAAIAAIAPGLARRFDRIEHRIDHHHVVVAGEGTSALGRLDGEAHQVTAGVDRILTLRYDDCYGRDADGRWRFASRDVHILAVHEQPAPSS